LALALATWSSSLRGSKVMLLTDSEVAFTTLSAGYSACPHLINIIQGVWRIATAHDIQIRFQWVPGDTNTFPDLISRGNTAEFLRTCSSASRTAAVTAAPQSFNHF